MLSARYLLAWIPCAGEEGTSSSFCSSCVSGGSAEWPGPRLCRCQIWAGRIAVGPTSTKHAEIVHLRKLNLSVPDIKAQLDASCDQPPANAPLLPSLTARASPACHAAPDRPAPRRAPHLGRLADQARMETSLTANACPHMAPPRRCGTPVTPNPGRHVG